MKEVNNALLISLGFSTDDEMPAYAGIFVCEKSSYSAYGFVCGGKTIFTRLKNT